MKYKIIYLLTIAFCLNACTSSKKIVTRTVTQKYVNLNFNPESITKTVINNTDITITPIDAKDLDQETYEAAFRDGNYEKEFISVIESWKSKLNSIPKQERSYLQGKINAFDCLTKLERDGKISPSISARLKRKIIDEKSGNDGTEVESLSDKSITPSDYNPYKINANYFSVFKMTFQNKGTEIEKINIKEFQLISDEEQLYPLASEYFEKNLSDRSETLKNSFRMNMPNELIITPGQKITKYIAVPAINTQKSKIQIQFIRSTKVQNFDFTINKRETEKSYNLERFDIKYEGDGDDISYKTFYVISYKDNIAYALLENKVFINIEKKGVNATVFSIGINPISSEIVFGVSENFSFQNLKNNKIKVKFEKIKKNKKTDTY